MLRDCTETLCTTRAGPGYIVLPTLEQLVDAQRLVESVDSGGDNQHCLTKESARDNALRWPYTLTQGNVSRNDGQKPD